MLTQRTNVLLSEPDYRMLKELSKKNNQSIGELIRHAITKTFAKKKPKKESSAQILKNIRKITKGMNLAGLNYKELRDYGRK